MLIIRTPVEHFENELAEEARLFSLSDDVCIVHEVEETVIGTAHRVTVTWKQNSEYAVCQGAPHTADALEKKRINKRAAKWAAYQALRKLTGQEQPWGSLTGVRPTKLLAELQKQGNETDFVDFYGVQPNKYDLARQILHVQEKAMQNVPQNAICVYVCVPFCVTRCSYCSFPGRIAKKGEMEAYLNALEKEISHAGECIGRQGIPIAAVYIGGGTPSSLPQPLFERLLQATSKAFVNQNEFTVEAGRPDTIDRAKLIAAKEAGVTRLCVNPQTMVQATLERIGRRHTPQQIVETVELARALGFTSINMDIIAGLPGETLADFRQTLRAIEKIAPSGLTCHTLSIKRGSRLRETGYIAANTEVAQMVDEARGLAQELGLEPYYMYRQKYMAGNLENVGYTRPGNACIYNIAMMDELRSVMALGVGSVGKWIQGDRIERRPNPKDLHLYLQRIDRICEQKDTFFQREER